MADTPSIETIGPEFFQPHLGKDIALADEAGSVLTLAQIQSVRSDEHLAPFSVSRKAFTLCLVAPFECGFGSRSLVLGHPDFGAVGPVYAVRGVPAIPGDTRAWFRVHFN